MVIKLSVTFSESLVSVHGMSSIFNFRQCNVDINMTYSDILVSSNLHNGFLRGELAIGVFLHGLGL